MLFTFDPALTEMDEDLNPFAPIISDESEDRSLCPICRTKVDFKRFYWPFGYCDGCRNYLTIRNWEPTSWSSLMVIPVVLLILIQRDWYQFWDTNEFIVVLWASMATLYLIESRLGGVLVPAVLWGFVALQDDDRLPEGLRPAKPTRQLEEPQDDVLWPDDEKPAVVMKVMVNVGDFIKKGQIVAEVDNGESRSLVPSSVSGTIEGINISVGETVDWNCPLIDFK
ncbi:acetyl-CoA carboxylase biotin carboxyl carrier protein subunit [Stieleria sp. JC731]|uniref:acetyl-CoA carboxylase biotin carboxyl carrier protein subunit n=1 Tax=Pirellulaceae TaxID=2691357 RepID=UPI001E647CF4|nr:acetyl-CoA carboxylase biotin carboxyl carrier protein subunit [Stieleria sp. JC731]MCC9599431.1 acetyl-CoA carboxylase biotin carboxyl carrier protein subunit [Stieleria sp. JC731]